MAYQREQTSIVLGDSLDQFVTGISSMYKEQLTTRNAEDELNFNKQVLEGNISLEDQLTYRKAQLDRVSDDPDEKRRISGEVSSLTARIRADKFTKGYTDQLTKFSAGAESVDAVISWLTDQRASTDDPAIQSKIDAELQTKQQQKFDLNSQMLKDQTNYALNDKTDSVIGNQISKIQSAKSAALLSGDQGTAASLDLQLQALQKAQVDNSISRDIKDMAVATATGFSSAVNLLDSYNAKIQNSGTSTPVTVNGVTYSNAQQYWTYARDSYLADQSGSGFFPRIDNELTTSVKVKNSNNTLTSNDITSMASTYNNLYGRPELANFSAKLDAAKADTLQTAANFISDKIVNSYDNNNDLNAAFGSLAALKNQGVNVDTAYQKIMTSATNIQNQSISEIVKQAQNLMQLTPGLAIGDAINQAISQGYGRNISPNATLGQTPGATAADILGTDQNKTGTPDTMNTINGQPASAAIPGAATTGGSYVIKAGDTLSKIAAANGTTVEQIAALNGIADPNKIQSGATLKLPGAPGAPGAPASAAAAAAPGTNGLPSYAGAEITGTPTGPYVTVNGKNYAYVAPGSRAQQSGTTSPSGSGGGLSSFDSSGIINSLRSQIANGSISPDQALASVRQSYIQSQQKNGPGSGYADLSTNELATIKSQLYAPLTINSSSGMSGTLNQDGSITKTSTTVNKSNTSISGGGTTATTTQQLAPQQQQPAYTPPTQASTPAPTPTYNPSPVAPTTPTTTVPAASAPASTTPKSTYQGVSIVDYLSSVGHANDLTSRTALAKQYGITNYTGTADQNTQLLKTLRGF